MTTSTREHTVAFCMGKDGPVEIALMSKDAPSSAKSVACLKSITLQQRAAILPQFVFGSLVPCIGTNCVTFL